MSQPVILKVYGQLWPANKELHENLQAIASQALPQQDYPATSLQDDLLKISFEGIYYPIDETLAAIQKQLTPNQRGKLDVLDLENWKLTRHLFENGGISCHSAPLNNVLDYSGH